jgi:hypothetical protein
MPVIKKSLHSDLSAWVLIFLWVYAASSKLFIYEGFRFQLLGHKLLANHAWTIAWLIPTVEILIALLLVIPKTRIGGLYASLSLLLLFTMYIIYMFMFYPYKPCSCGGVISKLTWKQHILFNLFFLLLAVAGIIGHRKTGLRKPSFPIVST